jgi:hypothetical protein
VFKFGFSDPNILGNIRTKTLLKFEEKLIADIGHLRENVII